MTMLTAKQSSLNLTPEEVQEASGGYQRPADQLKHLHARGFTRAFKSGLTGRVVLERGHYDAVVRANQLDHTPALQDQVPAFNVVGLREHLGKKRRA